MHFQFSYPNEQQLATYLHQQYEDELAYTEIGDSIDQQPHGYDLDYNYRILGQGEAIWSAAKKAIINWQQYPKPWTNIYPEKPSLKVGETVVVLFRVVGLWWINSARIVCTFDEVDRFGWAYGTLKDHVERGEECFWIERDAMGEVSYHIRAFSQPAYWMARIGYPLARRWQRQFVKDSMAAMCLIAEQAQNEIHAK